MTTGRDWKLVAKNTRKKKKAMKSSYLYTIFQFFRAIYYWIENTLGRIFFIKSLFLVAVIATLTNIWFLFAQPARASQSAVLQSSRIVTARRGTIYIHSIRDNKYIPLTLTEQLATITIDPSYLAKNISLGWLDKKEVVFELSANININYLDIESKIENEIQNNAQSKYSVLVSNATKEQGSAVERLRSSKSPLKFSNWLNYELFDRRLYPDKQLAGNILGYTQKFKSIREDAWNVADCRSMILENENRQTVQSFSGRNSDGVYSVGLYGLEQRFCSELGGLNGRTLLNSELRGSDYLTREGEDLYLTLDYTLQQKAEEILSQAIAENTFNKKTPRNGSILVLSLENRGSVQAGEVLALASWPNGDPNEYNRQEYVDNKVFENTNVSEAYEIGSVMKPLTVAAALNEWFSNAHNAKNQKTGLDPEWKFVSYGPKGKGYQEVNGTIQYIQNAEGRWDFSNNGDPYSPMTIEDCLYFSINTCLSDIEVKITNSEEERQQFNSLYRHEKTYNYYAQKFGFGQPTLVNLPPTVNGDVSNMSSNLNNTISYAFFSFGQGFTSTPLQLARAYTPLGRDDGTLVEPYIVRKTNTDDGEVLAKDTKNKKIQTPNPVPVLLPQSSKKIQELLLSILTRAGNTSRQLGENIGYRGYVDGYPIGAKTGTSQISRPDARRSGLCGDQETEYDCSTRLGLYDHTIVGLGPIGERYKDYPKVLIVVKVSEGKPGLTKNNYAVFNLGGTFSKMMKSTLEYLGVPPNL